MGIVITVFIGFVLGIILLAVFLSMWCDLKDYERVIDNYENEFTSMDNELRTLKKESKNLADRYKELMTDEVYWFSKYELATKKKLSRAKFTGTNKAYTEYCKSFEENIKGCKEIVTKYEEEHEKVTWCILFPSLHTELNLSGTKLQKELFEKKCKDEEKKILPKWISPEETIELAVGCGLSVGIK